MIGVAAGDAGEGEAGVLGTVVASGEAVVVGDGEAPAWVENIVSKHEKA